MKHWSYTSVIHVIVFAIAFLIAHPAFGQDNQQTKVADDGRAGADPASNSPASDTTKDQPSANFTGKRFSFDKAVLVVSAISKVSTKDEEFIIDLVDLQRQFITRLAEKEIASIPFSPRYADPETNSGAYILEISLDGLRESKRSEQLSYQTLEFPIFAANLSLTIRNVSNGTVIGNVLGYGEGRLNGSDQNSAIKRVVVQEAVQRLADDFAANAMDFEFGLAVALHSIPRGTQILAGFLAFLLVLALSLAVGASVKPKPYPAAPTNLHTHQEKSTPTPTRVEPQCANQTSPPKVDATSKLPSFNFEFEKRIKRAQVKALETDNFSDSWCHEAARARCEDILQIAKWTRENEAGRRIKAREIEDEYQRIGVYAWRRYDLDHRKVIEMLKRTDGLEYLLLQEAIRFKEEEVL